jgi:PAS domain S-box-containing protein
MNSKVNNSRNIILDSIADGVFTVDLDFKITSMNRSAEDILGIKEEEALGKLCFEIFHANICEHSCALRETISNGRNIINKTIYIVNSEGERIPVSISTAVLRDENGELIGGVETFRDISEIEELRKTIESGFTFESIVSKNKKMQDIFAILPDIAQSDSSVLIEGASGTGKELVARALHNLSKRKDNQIVVINCAALPDNLLESELFGYKAGAFTDAKRDKAGKIAIADGGTIFLDEIGELSQNIQVKLLRFLQEREYEPLGGLKPVKADVRIISATNRELNDSVKKGEFRDDLFYRINIVNVKLPLLKERKEDIPVLIRHFIRRFNIVKGKNIEGVSDLVMNIMMEYNYPGNIRELENIIEHAFILCKESYIQIEHLPSHLRGEEIKFSKSMTLEECEKLFVLKVLEKNGWNQTKSAKELGINQSTLWRKMKRYKLSRNELE